MFEPERDEAFHLGRGKPGSLGLDLHRWRPEVRKRIGLQITEVPDAECNHDDCESQDDPPGFDTGTNKPSHHGRKPPHFAAQI